MYKSKWLEIQAVKKKSINPIQIKIKMKKVYKKKK
jgi:hypothetical protein